MFLNQDGPFEIGRVFMRKIWKSATFFVAIVSFLVTPKLLLAQTLDFSPVAKNVSDFGYLLNASKWSWAPLDPKILFVCWENPEPIYGAQRQAVMAAVKANWQDHSGLIFQGWESTCSDRSVGIRIRISDEGPHTKGLGRQINGVQDGMVLNFTFQNWSPACKDAKMYELCVKSIAVHEFGHAIGLAHEQNRPDTPGECTQRPQGGNGDVLLTPWDRDSVMNYCNPVYNNNGVLSQGDIASVQLTYGKPN
jgi:hypothetical protein